MENNEQFNISRITNNIYLSGIRPVLQNECYHHDQHIKYIICCVKWSIAEPYYQNIISNANDTVILVINYKDNLSQDLWKVEPRDVKLIFLGVSKEKIQYFQSKILQYPDKPLIEIAYDFLCLVNKLNSAVLVHCMAGISRSVSVIAYYLMKKYSLTSYDAIEYLKSRRCIANPNSYFRYQLNICY